MENIGTLILVCGVMFLVMGMIPLLAHIYNLNNIKFKNCGRRTAWYRTVCLPHRTTAHI